jgi:AcrR family transcriptional regulator
MGRRSNHSREELQEMVIKAAREIVASEGVRELSTRKIVAKIGYTVGTLYHFFKNLDDIILHVNGVTLDMLYEFLEKRSRKATKQTAVQTLAHGYLEFSKKHFAEWQLLFEYPMPVDMEYPQWYGEKISILFSLVEQTLSTQMKLPASVASRTSRVLWSGIHGICTLYHTGKLHKTKSETAETLADDFIIYYLAGLKRDMG